MSSLRKKLLTIYERLLNCYGPQCWWPAESRLEMVVGAILTQSTSWKNVEKAIANLKSEGALDLKALYDLPAERLERLLRPSGFYMAKTKKLKAFVEHMHHNYGSSLDSFLGQDLRSLRDGLLSIYGVGPETADSIILYAAGKPIFVVDAYTHRLFSRIGLTDGGYDYRKLQLLFMDNLTPDVELFNEYHALIVRHSTATCRKKPLCQGCVINKMCEFGKSIKDRSTKFSFKMRFPADTYVPRKFRNTVTINTSLKLFGPRELGQLSRIFDHLRRGGVAVLSGPWEKILQLHDYVDRRRAELIEAERPSKQKTVRKRDSPEGHRQRGSRLAPYRLMVVAHGDSFPDVEPPFSIPYFLELLGDRLDASRGKPFLVPVLAVCDLQKDLEQLYPVQAIGGSILAPGSVLPPRSQETIDLIRKGLEVIKDKLPLGTEVLDMGCGSGCLSILAAEVLRDRKTKVTATDLMPEALAATKLNVDRFVVEGNISPSVVEVTSGGDLFEPVNGRRFDLVIFNAPWVVSRPRTRADAATHDEGQDTLRRFLAQASEHLKLEGHTILAYSDYSGQEAIEKLEESILGLGFKVANLFKDRIQSRRERRRWENVLVYDLVR